MPAESARPAADRLVDHLAALKRILTDYLKLLDDDDARDRAKRLGSHERNITRWKKSVAKFFAAAMDDVEAVLPRVTRTQNRVGRINVEIDGQRRDSGVSWLLEIGRIAQAWILDPEPQSVLDRSDLAARAVAAALETHLDTLRAAVATEVVAAETAGDGPLGEWMSAVDIADALGLPVPATRKKLQRLHARRPECRTEVGDRRRGGAGVVYLTSIAIPHLRPRAS